MNDCFMTKATVVLSLSITLVGCGGYGQVSPATYDYATALYSIANRRAAEALPQVREQIQQASESGEISSQESGWLLEIVDRAQQGDWEPAAKQARQIMEEQVHRS